MWGESDFGNASLGDAAAPEFEGVVQASEITPASVRLTWEAALSDGTLAEDMVYEVHRSLAAGDDFVVCAASNPGALSVVVGELEAETTYYFRVRARDTSGATSEDSPELSVLTIAYEHPIARNVSPPENTTIAPATPVQFDVHGVLPLRLLMVLVKFEAAWEVAYDGRRFSPTYRRSSVSGSIGDYHFRLRRSGGWPSPLVLDVRPVDKTFSEAQAT